MKQGPSFPRTRTRQRCNLVDLLADIGSIGLMVMALWLMLHIGSMLT